MYQVVKIPTGMLEENCYIVYEEESKKAFLVDPGDEAEKIIAYIEKHSLIPEMIINTHGHFDHIGAVEDLKKKYNIPFYIHSEDVSLLKNPELILV